MRISALLALAALVLVILYVDPTKNGGAGLTLFYGSAFLFLSAAFVLFFSWLGGAAVSYEELPAHLSTSFRQGILLSLMTVCLLLFEQYRILRWWDGLLVVAGFLLVELNFLTRK